MKYFISLVACAAFLFTVNGQDGKPLYAFYDRWSQLKGYWSDSIVYSADGHPVQQLRGKAVVTDLGRVVCWTDLNGSFFDLDGQLMYFSRLLEDKERRGVKLRGAKGIIPAGVEGNLFEPVLCYDFLPLEQDELQARNEVLLRIQRDARLQEQINLARAQPSRVQTPDATMISSLRAGQQMAAFVGNNTQVQSLKNEERRMVETTARTNERNSDNRDRSLHNASATIGRSQTHVDSGWIRPDMTLILKSGKYTMYAGGPFTTKDSVLYRLRRNEQTWLNAPAEAAVYFYNPLNEAVLKAVADYAYARICFDSANSYYARSEYMTAFQWCLWATKKRTRYTNAFILAAACMREMGNYNGALDYIDRVEDVAYEGHKEVLRAEIYLRQGMKNKAADCLKKARKTPAEEWAAYVKEKYAFMD